MRHPPLMRFAYPVALDLSGRVAVVVGEKPVAEGKVEGLLDAGVQVLVVAEGPAEALDALEADDRVAVLRRPFEPDDLDGAFLVVAWSPDPAVREAVFRAARARGVLANVMDDPPRCDFAAPAVVRRGDLTVAISTGGRSPALAASLRAELEERYGPEWAQVLDIIGSVRDETMSLLAETSERTRRWRIALDLEEAERLVREGRGEEARARLRSRLLSPIPEGAS